MQRLCAVYNIRVSRMRIIPPRFVSTKENHTRVLSRVDSASFIAPKFSSSISSGKSRQERESFPHRTNKSRARRRRYIVDRARRLRASNSARKINYGRGGELFAGFVALSSLVTFNLLAGINLILLYSSPVETRSLRS